MKSNVGFLKTIPSSR